jgi:hypothetical protein
MSSFLKVLEVHDRLHAAFFRHQSAVLDRDFGRARSRLDDYEAQLLEHMRDEEEALLPIYEREPPAPNGKVEFFLHEHKLMREALVEMRALLAATAAAGDADAVAKGMLALFDRQARYKGLAEHHELREERWLLPALDRLATADEKRELLARCLR